MVLDIAAYNKDNLSNAAGPSGLAASIRFRGNGQNIRIMTNADFGNTRGIDLRLDRRFGNLFNGTLAYTFQQAKNTGSDPDTYIDFGSRVLNQVSGGNQPPPQAILPTDFSRPHNLAVAAALNFPNDWQQGSIDRDRSARTSGVFATFRYTSGTPYTRCDQGVGRRGRRLGRQLRPRVPRAAQQLAAAVVQESGSPVHQGLWHRRDWT